MTKIRELPDFVEPPRYEFTRVRFKECGVAGVSFHIEKDDELWDELEVGTKVALVRDRNNQHDANAVAVALADDYDGNPDDFDFDFILGYIPRTDNAELAALLDAGYADKFTAEITHFQRFGKFDERIRITIWLETKEPMIVRPNCLRVQAITRLEVTQLAEDLNSRGVAYFRWGGFPREDFDLPVKGERILFLHSRNDTLRLYLMKVLAVGNDCAIYFDDPTEIHCCDDCSPFILGNIAGPIDVERRMTIFRNDDIADLSVYNYLAKEYSDYFEELFRLRTDYFYSPNNIDADPYGAE